jgi:hypothetical protein
LEYLELKAKKGEKKTKTKLTCFPLFQPACVALKLQSPNCHPIKLAKISKPKQGNLSLKVVVQ